MGTYTGWVGGLPVEGKEEDLDVVETGGPGGRGKHDRRLLRAPPLIRLCTFCAAYTGKQGQKPENQISASADLFKHRQPPTNPC